MIEKTNCKTTRNQPTYHPGDLLLPPQPPEAHILQLHTGPTRIPVGTRSGQTWCLHSFTIISIIKAIVLLGTFT